MKKTFFTLLFLLNALTNVYAQVPDWYNGDEELYNKFIETCKLAQKECPNKTYNCDNIKNFDEFNSLSINVGTCFLSKKSTPKEAIDTKDYTPGKPIGVASVRG